MKRLGIDLGGSRVKLGVVQKGQVLETAACDTFAQTGYDAVVARIAQAARPLLARHPEIVRVGLASPGLIDVAAGMVCYSNNFGWTDRPLRQDLRTALGLPVMIANDAHCATLGEALHGAGRGYDRVAMLTIGTGVGGGFVQGGRLETSRYGSMAYILGHMVTEAHGQACSCGREGCLEAYASAGALMRRVPAVCPEIPSVEALFAAARAGAPAAAAIVQEFALCLAEGAVSIANILRPQVIVIGGGVSASADLFLPEMNRRLEAGVYGYAYAPVLAVQATLGNTAGLVGAAHLEGEDESL